MSQCFTSVYVKKMLVLMGGGSILSPFWVQRFFSSFPHWATYKNRLDAVLGVDQIVFRDKPVTKVTLDLILAGVDCAPCVPASACCVPRNVLLLPNMTSPRCVVTFDHSCEVF